MVLAGGINILVGRVIGVVSGAAEGDGAGVDVDDDDEAPAIIKGTVPEPDIDVEPTGTPGNISKIILPTSTPAPSPPFPQLRLLHERATVGLNDGDEEASDA